MSKSSGKKIFALLNLAYQFVLHCLGKLCFWRKKGIEQFRNNYRLDSFLPLTLAETQNLFSFSACLNCRLCDSACPALFKISRDRFPGPSFLLTTSSRSFRDLWASSLDLSLCSDCEECVKVCPNKIDVKEAVRFIHKKVVDQIQYVSGGAA